MLSQDQHPKLIPTIRSPQGPFRPPGSPGSETPSVNSYGDCKQRTDLPRRAPISCRTGVSSNDGRRRDVRGMCIVDGQDTQSM